MVCCVLGLIIEVLFHFALYHEYQDRAGLLFGPFSPIYGFGALLMTIALNRFHDKPVWVVFLVSAVIGGAFEYFTSWIMEFSFGIRAWDYSGTFLSIDGRTNFVFMVMWGVLGVAWIKLLLPRLLKLINLIPWNWRYAVTAVCAGLMLVDGVMTVQSIDCWYARSAGQGARHAHRGVLREAFRQRLHGAPLPDHDHGCERRRSSRSVSAGDARVRQRLRIEWAHAAVKDRSGCSQGVQSNH